jgi:hypothetical protein
VRFYQLDIPDKSQPAVAPIPDDYRERFDRQKDPGEMRSVFGGPAYAVVQTNLMRDVFRLCTELKEPAKADPKSFGPPERYPYIIEARAKLDACQRPIYVRQSKKL